MNVSKALLRQYLRLVFESTPMARVPTQLLSPDDVNKEQDSEQDEDYEAVEEFSGVAGAVGGGSLGGFTAPLGTKKRK